jgi:hypothetical protein
MSRHRDFRDMDLGGKPDYLIMLNLYSSMASGASSGPRGL